MSKFSVLLVTVGTLTSLPGCGQPDVDDLRQDLLALQGRVDSLQAQVKALRFGIVTDHIRIRNTTDKTDSIFIGHQKGGTGGQIEVMDANGNEAVTVDASFEGAAIHVMDANGNRAVSMEATGDLAYFSLGSDFPKSEGLMEIYNKTGKPVVQVGTDQYGDGLVIVKNRKGEGRAIRSGP